MNDATTPDNLVEVKLQSNCSHVAVVTTALTSRLWTESLPACSSSAARQRYV